jgi:hypothetical protein
MFTLFVLADKPGRQVVRPPQRLGVCRTSCVKPQKIADQAIFYLANSVRSPIIVVFLAFSTKKTRKTYKYNRLLGIQSFKRRLFYVFFHFSNFFAVSAKQNSKSNP